MAEVIIVVSGDLLKEVRVKASHHESMRITRKAIELGRELADHCGHRGDSPPGLAEGLAEGLMEGFAKGQPPKKKKRPGATGRSKTNSKKSRKRHEDT